MKDKGSILKSQKIIERKRKQIIRISIIAFSTIAVLVLVPMLIVNIPLFSIKNIKIVSAKTLNEASVTEYVQSVISKDYFKFFPRNTFLTVGKKDLKTKIMHEFPPIKDLDISLHTPNTMEIAVSEREPFALWCREGKECFFFDKEGFIYSKAPEFSSPVYVEYRNGVEGEPIGERVSTKETFDRVVKLSKGISLYGLKVEEIVFAENNSVNFNLSQGSLYISLRGSDELTLANLGSLLDSPKTNLKNKNGGLTVSYIDLRFGNKVFYK